MSIVAIGCNHRSTPLSILERMTIAPDDITKALADLGRRNSKTIVWSIDGLPVRRVSATTLQSMAILPVDAERTRLAGNSTAKPDMTQPNLLESRFVCKLNTVPCRYFWIRKSGAPCQ